MIRAVQDIVKSCTFDTLKPKELPIFDIEYVFIQLRAKSVGEKTEVTITCPDDNETKTLWKLIYQKLNVFVKLDTIQRLN